MQTLTPTKPVESAEERMISKHAFNLLGQLQYLLGDDCTVELNIHGVDDTKLSYMLSINEGIATGKPYAATIDHGNVKVNVYGKNYMAF